MITEHGRRVVAAISLEAQDLTHEDVVHIYEALKALRSGQNVAALKEYKSGDLVEFNAKGRTVAGIVLDINRKTVSVKETGGLGLRWRVSPSLLRPYVPKLVPATDFEFHRTPQGVITTRPKL